MWRGHDSVSIVVEEEKHGRSASIHAFSFLGGAMPVPASMPGAKGRMAHNLQLASWEAGTPASFEATCGNEPAQGEAFPDAIFAAAALPKPVEWLPVASHSK